MEQIKQSCAAAEENPWQQYWGESYGRDLKQWLLKGVFDRLEAEAKIGSLIVDVGSGALPVTQLLKAMPARKRICVDIAADNIALPDVLRLRLDAEEVGAWERLSFRKAMVRAGAFLGIDPGRSADPEYADTIVFSDILNYVDFRKVLHGFAKYLKPDGRIIISNLPFRGNRSLFSANGLKDNFQLYAFLAEHDFEIEHKAFPELSPQETDESQELIVLVARKCAPPTAQATPTRPDVCHGYR
jgi:SAM-dependent methyltransferase